MVETAADIILKIDGLAKQYPTGRHALRGVSFTVPRGQVVAVIGSSGAGKSTLIRCINRLIEPTAGTVFLGDLDVTALSSRALRRARRRIGMIFQSFALVERLTVMENVLSGRLGYVGVWAAWRRQFPPADVARAFELLDRVGLSEFIDTRADKLSGGQRQRVGIARALIQATDLVLVDEPTAALDPITARRIMRLLTGLARERQLAVLVNSHDVTLAREFADRIIGLRDGHLVFDDAPDALAPETLTEIYGAENWKAIAKSEAEANAALKAARKADSSGSESSDDETKPKPDPATPMSPRPSVDAIVPRPSGRHPRPR